MCAFSVVSDYYINTWPSRFPNDPLPKRIQLDPQLRQMLKDVLDRLDKIDKRLGDIECHDETKAEFLRQVGFDASGK